MAKGDLTVDLDDIRNIQRQWQKEWRDNRRAVRDRHQVLANLDGYQIAILDAIAMRAHEDDPHDPPETLCSTNPSRQLAIEMVIEEYLLRHTAELKDKFRIAINSKKELSEFWKLEVSWRRCTNPKRKNLPEIKPPVPPWDFETDN